MLTQKLKIMKGNIIRSRPTCTAPEMQCPDSSRVSLYEGEWTTVIEQQDDAMKLFVVVGMLANVASLTLAMRGVGLFSAARCPTLSRQFLRRPGCSAEQCQ